jgi:formate hydrogenlyase subunit 3/multisubunit Na+/H+ antiporter MnhD subunit
MVAALLHPLNIFIVGLGAGFVIPLLSRLNRSWVTSVFLAALTTMALISTVAFLEVLNGAQPIDILTGGAKPPYAINLRFGIPEGLFAVSINLVALLGALYFLRAGYATMLLYLILVTGIQGMVMTRDLFNLFVFLEIVSIATYGLLSLSVTPSALSAAFKYLMATVLASTLFLLGTALLYSATGMLNIDDLIAHRNAIVGPIAFAASMFLLASLLIELKPFPANGWGLDAYETAQSNVAALISVGVSAGVFFALFKLLPLFHDQLELIGISGIVTFLFSNLIGLRQVKVQRLLGYSSIGQIGLLTTAAALLAAMDARPAMLLVVGGLFVNHLLAKAGLFWLAGYVGKERLDEWTALAGQPVIIVLFAALIAAICGLPPFPGFWAKWTLVLELARGGRYVWIVMIMIGSLLEAAYLFRWFGQTVHARREPTTRPTDIPAMIPIFAAALLLMPSGWIAASNAGVTSPWVVLPLVAGLLVLALDWLSGRLKCAIVSALALLGGIWLIRDLSALNQLFAVLLLSGGIVLTIACAYRGDPRQGFYPLLAVLLLSLPALPRATTSLEFLFLWEMITLSSYFLVLRRRDAATHALCFLLFSLVSAYFLLMGFALINAVQGTIALAALRAAGPDASIAFLLLAIGVLIKAGTIGVHIWLPGTYAEAEDDISAMLSAVISKVAIFGLLIVTYVAVRSEAGLDLARLLGWIGMATTLVAALLAVRQDDIKRMLAYSSMSQLGYIVTAVALLSHLGWVTALYLTANHLMVKGILFLTAASVILRTGTRSLAALGGLAGAMPLTFAAAAVAIIAMSGLPPLAGFGGKWLLLSAMIEKGWYGSALMALLATFVGLLYMVHFIRAIFLGAGASAHHERQEAPLPLLISQYLLVLGILIMSFFPKLLIDPISKAIDPDFASTLVWQGMSLELIYGYWNPLPTMAFAVGFSAALFWIVRWFQRSERIGSLAMKEGDAYAICRSIALALTPPLAWRFWNGALALALAGADSTRRVYTGDGQVYAILILYYFIMLYAASGVITPNLIFDTAGP